MYHCMTMVAMGKIEWSVWKNGWSGVTLVVVSNMLCKKRRNSGFAGQHPDKPLSQTVDD